MPSLKEKIKNAQTMSELKELLTEAHTYNNASSVTRSKWAREAEKKLKTLSV